MKDKVRFIPFKNLHEQYRGIITRYVFFLTKSRENADDIAQDIFLSLWVKWSKVGEFSERELEDYIYIMVRNRVINEGKKANTKIKYSKYFRATVSEVHWHDEVLLTEGFRLYENAVENLTPQKRLVYILHGCDLQRKEIAEKVHSSESTVNNQLHSAFKKVKTYLNTNFDLNIKEDSRKKFWGPSSLN